MCFRKPYNEIYIILVGFRLQLVAIKQWLSIRQQYACYFDTSGEYYRKFYARTTRRVPNLDKRLNERSSHDRASSCQTCFLRCRAHLSSNTSVENAVQRDTSAQTQIFLARSLSKSGHERHRGFLQTPLCTRRQPGVVGSHVWIGKFVGSLQTLDHVPV